MILFRGLFRWPVSGSIPKPLPSSIGIRVQRLHLGASAERRATTQESLIAGTKFKFIEFRVLESVSVLRSLRPTHQQPRGTHPGCLLWSCSPVSSLNQFQLGHGLEHELTETYGNYLALFLQASNTYGDRGSPSPTNALSAAKTHFCVDGITVEIGGVSCSVRKIENYWTS